MRDDASTKQICFSPRLGGFCPRPEPSGRCDSGSTATEYAVLLGFIAVAAGVGIAAYGGALRGLIEWLVTSISARLG